MITEDSDVLRAYAARSAEYIDLVPEFIASARVEAFEHAVTAAYSWPVDEMVRERAGFGVVDTWRRDSIRVSIGPRIGSHICGMPRRLSMRHAFPGNRGEAPKRGRASVQPPHQRAMAGLLPLDLPPTHPGEILMGDLIEGFGITPNKLAVSIGVPPRRINGIVHGKRAISP